MNKEKYWKVLRYRIDKDERRYPLAVIVKIRGDETEHFWKLPEDHINSDDYDWTDAIETDNLFNE